MIRKIGYGTILLALGSVVAMGQEGGDPPSRVARLNFLNGPVSFRPGSVEDWTAASLNYPLTTGDHLWADNGARAEMHVGSTAIRLDTQTAFSILQLDDAIAQFSLTEGTINLRVRYLAPGDSYEVDTPNTTVVVRQPGEYRITTHADNSMTQVSVMGGTADVSAGGNGFPLSSGQSVQLVGEDQVQQQMAGMPMPDGFDEWCHIRDRRENGTVSARYVPRDMIGYEDLDEYGVWRETPQYGWVWSPRGVAASWAPYHNGHWAWVEPWGWTWIDDAPWGFAPFHYGRWAFAAGAWVWVPGRMEVVARVRPVYAPALVAFVGGGGFSVGVSVGGGGMAAWFPLGPGEVYMPGYHVSPRYVENINIVHVNNVTVIRNYNVTNVTYVNQSVHGAVMVVPHDAFVQSRHVTEVAVVVPHEQIMRARVVGSTAQIAPVRESIVGRASVGVVVHAPPARFAERQVVVQHAPPPPPVSFAAKEQMLRNNGGRPLDTNQMNSVRHDTPAHNPAVRTQGQPPNIGSRPNEGNRPNQGNRPSEINRPNEAGRPNEVNRSNESSRPATNTRPDRNDRPNTVRPDVNHPNQGQGQTQNQTPTQTQTQTKTPTPTEPQVHQNQGQAQGQTQQTTHPNATTPEHSNEAGRGGEHQGTTNEKNQKKAPPRKGDTKK